jgi:hypothetical protein
MGQSLADYGWSARNLVWSADALPQPGMEPSLVIPTMNTLLGRARQRPGQRGRRTPPTPCGLTIVVLLTTQQIHVRR